MYLAHYGLTELPFSITPDPRFVFLSERHRDALAHLMFGIDQGGSGGFVQLTGEVGTGKTTLCRVMLEQLPAHVRVALVLNPQLSPVELLETICEELRLDLDGCRGSRKALVDLLNTCLLAAYAQGERVVLVIDEAQDLSADALEQVRLLTNLETPTQKLLQVILMGQPELRTMLAREDLRQLAQRITARFHLTPLDQGETLDYLRHRWRVAGGQRFPFTADGVRRIHHHAGGVPRLLNIIAERTLLAGYAHDAADLDRRWVDRAAREALAPRPAVASRRTLAAVLATLAGVALLAAWWLPWGPLQPDKASTALAAPVPPGRAAPPAHDRAPVAPAPIVQLDGPGLAARLQAGDLTLLAGSGDLLTAWQLPVDAGHLAAAAECTGFVAGSVRCVRGWATLDKLATLGRPAVLRLRGPRGEAWPLLVGLDAVNARLRLGDALVDVDRIALGLAWSGDYQALWALPAEPGLSGDPSLASALARGARGPAIDWVARMLGHDRGDVPVVYDARMAGAVRDYQRARGLASDGVIGPETLMAMTSAAPGARLARVLE